MSTSIHPLQRFNVHGAAVGMTNWVPGLRGEIDHLLGEFGASAWGEKSLPITGSIWPYEQSHVLRHLSPVARRVRGNSDLLELYEDNERFWLVDDRWGIAEMNLLKGQWRSWVLPNPSIDAVRIAQLAILWPMAQLLRARGLYLVPAASVSFADRSLLIISPFGIEPELSTLIRAGYRVIGQSWTAIREQERRFSLLNLPGHVQRSLPPGMRLGTDRSHEPGAAPRLCPGVGKSPGVSDHARSARNTAPLWIDLMREHDAAEQQQGWCDAVLVVDPVRRPHADVRPLERGSAGQSLRQAWPIFELHPNRRHGQLPSRLAINVPCYQLHLSREPRDLLRILSNLKTPTTAGITQAAPLRAAG